MRRAAGLAAGAGAAALAAVAAGCSSVGTLDVGPPPATSAAASPAAVAPLPDSSKVSLPPVDGRETTTSVAIGPGTASITGTVLGPAGPVAGATVEADRVVGDASAMTEATTGTDGSFAIQGILGGAYRVRAWQAPALAATTPQLFFLADGAQHQLSLQVEQFTGVQVGADMAPATVLLGNPATLAVSVTTQVVGPDGVVRPAPDPAQPVVVDGGLAWTALGPVPLSTGTDGSASVQLRCDEVGTNPVTVTVAGAAPLEVRVPSCEVAAPAPTTTTTIAGPPPAPPPTSTGAGGGGGGDGAGKGGGHSTSTLPGPLLP